METNRIIKLILCFLASLLLSYLLLYLVFGNYTSGYLVLLGCFGMLIFLVLDIQTKVNINFYIKSIVALTINLIIRVHDLNNFQRATNGFEYLDNGVLVKYSHSDDSFRFIEIYDFVLILMVTIIMISIYQILKFLNKKQQNDK
ncbi:hypothetical protein C8D91_0612 [Marinicella litoralis]|uniref:Uncharacterized protein n=1 Tax=Marinicella litoralis TaxID=644220 RepID=A0A4R6XZL1_9GAMM|nr:hypothetical protein C8D91_0612 [Marinicella litoralis]